MYVKYNAVLRGQGGLLTGATSYSATIYLICSGLRKLSRTTKVPKGMVVYRGNGDMALPLDFLEPDAQVYSLHSLYLVITPAYTILVTAIPLFLGLLGRCGAGADVDVATARGGAGLRGLLGLGLGFRV